MLVREDTNSALEDARLFHGLRGSFEPIYHEQPCDDAKMVEQEVGFLRQQQFSSPETTSSPPSASGLDSLSPDQTNGVVLVADDVVDPLAGEVGHQHWFYSLGLVRIEGVLHVAEDELAKPARLVRHEDVSLVRYDPFREAAETCSPRGYLAE